MSISNIKEGMLITAPVFPEPVKVLTVKLIGQDKVKIEAVGQRSRKFYDPIWLYVVEHALSNPVLYTLQNPAACLDPEEEVNIVRYIVKDWKQKASRERRSG